MRDAPPVTLPAGRSPFAALLGTGLPLALTLVGLGLTALWAWQAPGWRPALAAAAWLAYALITWRGRRPLEGGLSWDGGAWHWREMGAEGRQVLPEVALDLQGLILLRLRPAGAAGGPQRWLWLTPDGDPGRWQALRRALYSSRSHPAQ